MDINSPFHQRFEPVVVLLNSTDRDAALRNDPEYAEWLDKLAAQTEAQ